ncbi:hypothetical protein ON010_g4666 [Phytophthora cinnamomi]|nr:hypothetical protein ON010_g4666 [Phytophthora cinnamomi]
MSQFWLEFWDSEAGNLSWGQNYDVDSISQSWHPKAEMKSDAARHAFFPDPRLHISWSGPQANLRPNSKSPSLRLLPPLSGLRTPGIPNYPEGQGSIRHPEPDPRPGTSDLWPLERFSDLRLQTEFKSQTWGSGVAATQRSQSSVSRCSQHNLKYVQKPDLGQEISTFQVTCGRNPAGMLVGVLGAFCIKFASSQFWDLRPAGLSQGKIMLGFLVGECKMYIRVNYANEWRWYEVEVDKRSVLSFVLGFALANSANHLATSFSLVSNLPRPAHIVQETAATNALYRAAAPTTPQHPCRLQAVPSMVPVAVLDSAVLEAVYSDPDVGPTANLPTLLRIARSVVSYCTTPSIIFLGDSTLSDERRAPDSVVCGAFCWIHLRGQPRTRWEGAPHWTDRAAALHDTARGPSGHVYPAPDAVSRAAMAFIPPGSDRVRCHYPTIGLRG